MKDWSQFKTNTLLILPSFYIFCEIITNFPDAPLSKISCLNYWVKDQLNIGIAAEDKENKHIDFSF